MNLEYEEYIKLRSLAEQAYVPVTGVNPVDNLLMPLLGKHEVKAGNRESAELGNRIIKKLKALNQQVQYSFSRKRLSGKVREAQVVFFIAEPTHQKQMLPIGLELKQQGISTAVISTKLPFRSAWENAGIPFWYISPAISKPDPEKEINFRTITGAFSEHIADEETRKKVSKRIITEGPVQANLWYELSRLLGNSAAGQVWLIGNDLALFGRLTAEWANSRGATTMSIQHGIIPDDRIHGEHKVNYLMVFGEAGKKGLLKQGMAESRIQVTGAPYLDELLHQDRSAATAGLVNTLGLEQPYEKRVLIAFSGAGHRTSEEHHKAMIASVTALARRHPDHEFIFKLHRKDKITYYQEALSLPNIKVPTPLPAGLSTDIFDWLTLSPVLVTGNSAAGAEAILFDKIIFTLDFMDQYQGVDFRDQGASIHSRSEKELEQNFGHYLKGELPTAYYTHAAAFAGFYFYDHRGKNVQRCTRFITEKLKPVS